MMCPVLILLLWGFVLSIIAFYGWFTYFVVLCEDSSSAILLEDSSSPVWIRPFILLWFSPLSQSRYIFSDYRRLVSTFILNAMLHFLLGL